MEFPVKCIKWLVYEHVTPILLQVSNGPCPLIALVNTLLLAEDVLQRLDMPRNPSDLVHLRRLLTLHVGETVKCSDVVAALGDVLLATQDLDQSVVDNLLNWLPLLYTGLEVNPNLITGRFQGTDLAAQVFSSFGLTFVHGWCIAPSIEDENYLDDDTYLVNNGDLKESTDDIYSKGDEDRGIHDETHESENVWAQGKDFEVRAENFENRGETFQIQTKCAENQGETVEKQSKSFDNQNEKKEFHGGSVQYQGEKHTDQDDIDHAKYEEKAIKKGDSCKTHSQRHANDGDKQEIFSIFSKYQDFNSIQDYLLQNENNLSTHKVQEWLRKNSTQLTSRGLMLMHQQIAPETVAIFFRNNHFSTIYKSGDDLFVLLTDGSFDKSAGYVWQSLTSILGSNDTFYNGDFTPISESSNVPGERYEVFDSENVRFAQKIQEKEDSNYAALLQKQYDSKHLKKSGNRPNNSTEKLQKSSKNSKLETGSPSAFQRLKSDCTIV